MLSVLRAKTCVLQPSSNAAFKTRCRRHRAGSGARKYSEAEVYLLRVPYSSGLAEDQRRGSASHCRLHKVQSLLPCRYSEGHSQPPKTVWAWRRRSIDHNVMHMTQHVGLSWCCPCFWEYIAVCRDEMAMY